VLLLCCAVLQAVHQQPVDVAAERLEAYCALTAAELLGDAKGYQFSLAQLVTLLARDKDIVSGASGQRGEGMGVLGAVAKDFVGCIDNRLPACRA
jgi:hypothetical protein